MPILIDQQGHLVQDKSHAPDETILALAPDVDPLSLNLDAGNIVRIDIHFAHFTDGRGYSLARLLRQRLHWKGEIRAVGDVLVDQLGLLKRCGFDQFALRDDQSATLAQRTLKALSLSYQTSYPIEVTA